jgi:hypothetical protein
MPLSPKSLLGGYGTDDMPEDVESVERAPVMGAPLSPSSLMDTIPVIEQEGPEEKIRAAYRNSRGLSPEQAAQDLELAKKLGVESGLVQRNRDQFAEEDELQRLQDVAKTRPALQRVLETPEGMAASRDDVDNLAMLEDSFAGGLLSDDISEADVPSVGNLAKGLAKGTLKGATKGAASILGVMPYNAIAYATGALDDAAMGFEQITGLPRGGAFGAVRDWALANARSIQEGIVESELLELSDDAKGQLIENPELLLNPEWVADNVAQGVANVLAMAGAAYATGGGSLAAAGMGAMAEAGQLYNDLLADGVDGPTAHVAATGFGGVVGALEKVGADRWLGKERVKSLASRIVKSTVTGAVEAGTEWAEEPTGAFIESIAKGESLEQAAEKAAIASRNIDVMVGAFAAGGSMAYVGKYRSEQKLAERAQRNKDFFQQINEGVAASKLRERSTGIFKTYAQAIEDMGIAPSEVYIPVDALQKAVADEESFISLLEQTDTLSQLDAALAVGGDIAFPLSEFMTHIAGTDAGVALEEDFRFDPNDMTPREARNFIANMPELFAGGFDEAQQQAEKLIAEEEQGREVRDFVKNALLGVGMSEEEADANAAIWGARAIIAARDYTESGLEMTPQEWLKEHNLVVTDDRTGKSMSVSGLMEGARTEGQGLELQQAAETAGADVNNAAEVEEAARLWREQGTESPYFKRWADGRQVFEVYHGTGAEFDAFDTSDRSMDLSARNPLGENIGSFFASKERDAKRFGPNVGKYYVGLKNPMFFKTQEDFRAFMRENSGMTPDVRDAEGFIISEGRFENNMRKAIESAGHDGVVILNPQYSAKKDKPWVVAFDPTQIKSATGNRGTFDPSDARIMYQSAFHGTPHKFDKFTLDAIGSGEGAQAYGWGLYFAGRKDVAEWYREELTRKAMPPREARILVDGKPIGAMPELSSLSSLMKAKVLTALDVSSGSVDGAIFGLNEQIRGAEDLSGPLPSLRSKYAPAFAFLESIRDRNVAIDNTKPKGQLYEVDIPEDDVLLHWDKPLSEQPEKVREALETAVSSAREAKGGNLLLTPGHVQAIASTLEGALELTGRQVYHELAEQLGNNPLAGGEWHSDKAASEYLNSIGIKGIKYLDGTSRAAGEGSYNYVIFDDNAIEILNTFYQPTQDTSRGLVRFENTRTLVRLFKRADKSTFLHETAHIFLNDFRKMSKLFRASDRVLNEWQALEAHWEKNRDKVYADAMKAAKEGLERSKKRYEDAARVNSVNAERYKYDLEAAQKSFDRLSSEGVDGFNMAEDDYSYYASWVWVGRQEVFARSFETYVREGKAPSLELGNAFKRFKNWLLGVYRSMRRLNVELSDDVRGLMDRMLATEEQIAEAEAIAEYAPLYTSAEEAGMTDEEFAIYSGAHSEAREKAREIMLAKLMRQIKDRNAQWYREERKRLESEIRADLNAERGYRAVHYLSKGYFPDETKPELTGGLAEASKGNMRISSDAIKEGWGAGTLADLYKAVPPIYSKKGVHPDVLATWLGYTSGDEMVQELSNLRPLKEVIAESVESRMQEFEDLLSDENVRATAEAVLRDDSRLELLAVEQDIAERKIASVFSEQNRRAARERVKFIREAARQTIGRMKVNDAIKPAAHQRAERKAAREAVEAAKRGDMQAVAAAKQRQLAAAALASESLKAKEEVERARKYLGKFNKPATRKAIAREHLDQIDQILERFDLRKSTTLTEIGRRESLANWLKAQREKGFEPAIPPLIEAEANRMSYKAMSLDALRSVRDSVKSIETVGRRLETVMTARKKRLFNETVAEMVVQVEQIYGDKLGPERISREAAKKGVGSIFKGIDASLTKVEFLCLALDGGKANGLWWDMIYRPIKEGVNNKNKRLFESRNEIYGPDIFGRYTKDELTRFKTQKFFIREINDSLTKEQILAVALNRGNSHNWKSLLTGEGWTEEQGNAVLSRLDERDWDVVEKIWSHVDSFWPDIVALYRRLNGTVPEKVEAEPFVINGRKLRGGYYPLVADRDLSVRAAQREDAKSVQEMFGGGGFVPTTRNGHTKERTNFGGQRVALSLDVLVRHIDQVTHDIYLREAVIDVDRLLQNGRIQDVLIRSVGREQYDQLRPWLAAVAGQKPYDYDDLQRVAKLLRKSATFAIMGLKATVFLSQYAGLLNAIPIMQNGLKAGKSKISARMFKHLMQLVKSPSGKLGKLIEEKSLEMRDRRHNFTQEMHDISSNFGFGRHIKKWEEAMMYFTALADYHVSGASWVAAYELALEEGKTEQQAVDFADSVVTMGQGSGKDKDISAMQRGNEYKRMWMMFFSYMNTNYNQIVSSFRTLRTGKRKGKFFGELAFYWLFPTIAAELLAGRGPDDDEDEEWLAWGAYTVMMHPTGMIPVVRDAVRIIEDDYGRPVSLVGRLGSSIKRAGTEYLDDDGDDAALFWATVEVGSYFVPFPSAQARITIGQAIEYMNDERESYNPLFYRKK